MLGCHIVTPSTIVITHYFWGAAFDVPEITQEVEDKTKASVVAAFNEDKDLLQKLQKNVDNVTRGLVYLELTLGADGAGVMVRQLLNSKLAAEGRSLT